MIIPRKFIFVRRLSVLQRTILGVGCSIQAVRDPYRYDCVAYATEATTAPCQLKSLREKIAKTEEGRRVLAEKPLISSNTLDFEVLRRLPNETLGTFFF